MPYSSGLKTEAVCSSIKLVSTYNFTGRYNAEDQHRHLHLRENPIYHHIFFLLYLLATFQLHSDSFMHYDLAAGENSLNLKLKLYFKSLA
jgi:hypothetical protein